MRGDQTFHYRVPERLLGRLHPGQLVMAPFGSRQLPGVVTALAVTSPVEETRELLQLVWEPRLIGPRQLALARWVAARYGAPLRSVLDLVAPPRLAHHLHAAYTAADADGPAEDLPRAERRVLELLRERGGLSEVELRGQLGKTAATRGVARLVRQGLVNRHLSLLFPEPPAERLAVAVAPTNGELPAELLRRAPKQRALWEHLRRAGGPLPVAQALREVSASRPSLQGLVDRGLARIENRWSTPYVIPASHNGSPDEGTPDPAAWSKLSGSLTCESPRAVVMQGAESDRWPLYAAAIERVAAEGRQAARGGAGRTDRRRTGRMAGRQGWRDSGRHHPRANAHPARVVCGARCGPARSTSWSEPGTPRSPRLTRLGLVIVEREEDAGHKQRVAPRYHVPVCAAKLAELCGCLLVLGTETPRVDTFHAVRDRAGAPRYGRVARAVALGAATRGRTAGRLRVPWMSWTRAGRRRWDATGAVSRALYEALRETLASGGRAVMYVNRRGTAALTICRQCAHIFECPRCSTGLVQHRLTRQIVCHLCNWRGAAPRRCPVCEGGPPAPLGLRQRGRRRRSRASAAAHGRGPDRQRPAGA